MVFVNRARLAALICFLVISVLLESLTDILSIEVFALSETYLDFSLSSNILKNGQESFVQFDWDIKDFDMVDQKRLTVRPFLSAGTMEIFNEDLHLFIASTEVSSRLPYLKKEMLVRFNDVQDSQTSLSLKFVIYDTLTGKNYSTPSKKVWGMAYYKKYTDLLNQRIIKNPEEFETAMNAIPSDLIAYQKTYRDPLKIYLWYLSPAFFLYGLLKFPNGFG